eukprot:TRINITY_DN164_c1_g1_i1.p7 TRINITY_DN164_c1_g1~~TRINITY_DN164_c1_g1_i1.p7  ORF type:complete len:113 (+),score=9.65 TRINITY_DN164_c1_g1_i1:1519-1857(+)
MVSTSAQPILDALTQVRAAYDKVGFTENMKKTYVPTPDGPDEPMIAVGVSVGSDGILSCNPEKMALLCRETQQILTAGFASPAPGAGKLGLGLLVVVRPTVPPPDVDLRGDF